MLSLPAENHLVVLIFVPAGIPADAARLAARHIGNQLQELAHNRKAHRPADEGVAEVNVLQPSPQGRNAFFLGTAIARSYVMRYRSRSGCSSAATAIKPTGQRRSNQFFICEQGKQLTATYR